MTAADAKAAVLAECPHARPEWSFTDSGRCRIIIGSGLNVYRLSNFKDTEDEAWIVAAKRLNIKLNRPT